MNNPTKNDSRTDASGIPDEFLCQLGKSILAGLTPIRTDDSPPEVMLGATLRLLLQHELSEGRLEVRSRERVVLPSSPATEVEVDLLLHQPVTGASGAIEVVSQAWHRRDAEEVEREVQRERLLRRHYPLEVYAAREVIRDPWGTALEIVGLLGGEWKDFEAVVLPPTVRNAAETFAASKRPRTPVQEDERTATTKEPKTPVCRLARIREVVAALPVEEMDDPSIRAIREDYPRAYETWHPEEEAVLRSAFRAHLDVDRIADALGRTESAVWRHLQRIGIVATSGSKKDS